MGRRPLDGGNADGAYTMMPIDRYVKEANEQRFVCAQIEDTEALEELDQIAAMPGIDMLFFGQADFSQCIGAPGKIDHPKVRETRRLVAEAARRHGKFAGINGTLGNLRELILLGYRFFGLGADVVGLSSYFSELRTGFGRITKRPHARVSRGSSKRRRARNDSGRR